MGRDGIDGRAVNRDVLIISPAAGAGECAEKLAEELGSEVEVAATRRAGLTALGRGEFGVVVVDGNLVEGDVGWADEVWERAGLALSMEVNFAISGCGRLGREVKAALLRRERERTMARETAMRELENELKSAVTGLQLESELALEEPGLSPVLQVKLKHLVELAGSLRERLKAGERGRV